MDSKIIEFFGLIKDLQVHLAVQPDIMITMDIVMIDVHDAWGMFLSRKWGVDIGGSMQMDLSYATIPNSEGIMVRLARELERKYHAENPKKPYNEIMYEFDDLGNYDILVNFIAPLEKEVENKKDSIWHMNFDGAHSKFGKGAGIVLASPLGHIFNFAYRLEFDATNNVAEYETLFLDLELAKDLKIKLLSIKGGSDLIILQVKNHFACKYDRLKKYCIVV